VIEFTVGASIGETPFAYSLFFYATFIGLSLSVTSESVCFGPSFCVERHRCLPNHFSRLFFLVRCADSFQVLAVAFIMPIYANF
jgi:hypothetical protein